MQRWKNRYGGLAGFSRNTRLVWGLIALLALADAFGLHFCGMKLADGTLPLVLSLTAVLLLVAFIYTALRPDPRLAALAHLAATVLGFSVVAAVGSYIAVVAGSPLFDSRLAAADRALGFDWPAVYDWVAARPLFSILLRIAYWTPPLQMIVLLVVLNFSGRIGRSWEMQWICMLTVTGALAVSALWPAAGAFGYFHVREQEPYVGVFKALRDGTLRTRHKEELQCIIQFPSLHVAWAIIYTYAARGRRYLFPILLMINALVVLATPVIGGHHLADLWGGIALTCIAVLLVRKMTAAGLLPEDIK